MEHWVCVDHVAGHLACSVDRIYCWLARRGFPGHRVGRVYRFNISEVDAWVRADGADDVPARIPG
jgi:excisionase family DNA binding protein